MKCERLLEVRNVTFAYHGEKKPVLKNVSFDINRGFVYGVVGRNSVGKSTLLKLLAGYLEGFEGSICLDGGPAADMAGYKERICATISGDGFLENLSIGDNGILKGSFYERFDEGLFYEYLERYQLNPNTCFYAHSAGEKVKFYLAFALACQPEVLILDEPAGVLDGKAREEFMHLISYLAAEKEITVLMATHLTNDLDKLADYILFVNEDGTTAMYEKERLNDRYVLLKGTKKQLESLEHIVAMEVTETTATAMTDDLWQIQSQVEEIGLTKEIATVEDIMYYNHLGRAVMQEEGTYQQCPGERKNVREASRFDRIQGMCGRLTAIQGRQWNFMIMLFAATLGISYAFLKTDGVVKAYLGLVFVLCCILAGSAGVPKDVRFPSLFAMLTEVPVSRRDCMKFTVIRLSVGRIIMLLALGILTAFLRDVSLVVLVVIMFLVWIAELAWIVVRRMHNQVI